MEHLGANPGTAGISGCFMKSAPLFVTSGLAEKGDAWVDPRGMWLAVRAAQPAWELFGREAPEGEMPPWL